MRKKGKKSRMLAARTDPFGSYTGVTTDGKGIETVETPVQDVDDL